MAVHDAVAAVSYRTTEEADFRKLGYGKAIIGIGKVDLQKVAMYYRYKMLSKGKVIVVMGVSGSGKTTVGRALAEQLACPFYDGDDFHRPEQIAKMSAGIPLNDSDRAPWLANLHHLLHSHLANGQMIILACSALKKSYRQQLRGNHSEVSFVYLQGTFEQIQPRMVSRPGHYMPPTLLHSQFQTLEPPGREEALTVDINQPLPHLITTIRHQLDLTTP